MIIKLRKRTRFERIRFIPKAFIRHYRIFRKYNDVPESIYFALVFALSILI